MRTICLYFEIHQIIHLKRSTLVPTIITMMIMPMRQVLMRLPNVLIFRLSIH